MTQKTYSAEELKRFENWLDNEKIFISVERRFYMACLTGDLNKIIKLKKHINIRAQDNLAVRYAALNGHLNIVKHLHEHGANIHAVGEEAIRYAALKGHLDVVKYLHEQGADICAIDDYALRWAVENHHRDVVQYILSVVRDFDIVKKIDVTDWTTEHFKQFFSFPFMVQNPFMVQRVWDIVPQDKKTPAVIKHYQKNMTVVLLRNPLQQRLAVG